MKSFALLIGKLSLTFSLLMTFTLPAKAEWTSDHWLWTGVATAGIVGVAQLDDSEVIYASLYGLGAIYTMHFSLDDENSRLEDFVIPTGLTTMALLNFILN